jgi:hypothetical protein
VGFLPDGPEADECREARKPFDLESYIQKIQSSPCFICERVAGRLNGNQIIHRSDAFIIFLNKYPVLYSLSFSVRVSRIPSNPLMNRLSCSVFRVFGVSLTPRL